MPEERYIFDKARGVATSVVGIPTEFAGHSAVRYKPRYSAVMFVILGLFFVSGLLWTWNNLMGENMRIIGLLPLVLSAFGIWMAMDYFRKRYVLNARELYIHSGSKAYHIAYESITSIKKGRINRLSKEEKTVCIRAETSSYVLIITFTDRSKPQKIMVSPARTGLFVNHLLFKIDESKNLI